MNQQQSETTKQWFSPLEDFIELPESSCQQNPLFYHCPSNSTVERKLIRISERDYNQAFEAYQWRFLTQYPIVKVLHGSLEKQNRDGVCVNIFIEKIDCTLENMHNLSLLQSLYLLKTSLTAIDKLIQKFGFFDLTSKMIGITRNKECKIWPNDDLTSFQNMRDCISQQMMIDRLFFLIEERTTLDYQSRNFFTKASHDCYTFIKSQNFINQFAYDQDIVVPPIFVRRERRNSVDARIIHQIEPRGNEFKSFVSNQNSGLTLGNNNIISRTERKSQFASANLPYMKTSYSKAGSKAPTNISFTYQSNIRNRDSQFLRTPFPMQSLFELKESKQNLAYSAENLNQRSLFECRSQPFLCFSKPNKESSISLGNECNSSQFRAFEDVKKMSIISTLSMKIKSEQTIQECKTACMTSDSHIESNQDIIKKLFHENFQTSEWKKTVSQLFSSDKNLKESLSYGEEEKAYLKDLDLKKLNKLGRFISTSVLERDSDQENQYVPDIKGFLH